MTFFQTDGKRRYQRKTEMAVRRYLQREGDREKGREIERAGRQALEAAERGRATARDREQGKAS